MRLLGHGLWSVEKRDGCRIGQVTRQTRQMFKVFSKYTWATPVGKKPKNTHLCGDEMRIKEEEELVGSCSGHAGKGAGVAGFE